MDDRIKIIAQRYDKSSGNSRTPEQLQEWHDDTHSLAMWAVTQIIGGGIKGRQIEAMKEAETLLLETVFFLDPPERPVSMLRSVLANSLKGAYSELMERRKAMETIQ
jgi:hypothetical protein